MTQVSAELLMNLFKCTGVKNYNDFLPYGSIRLAVFVAKQFCSIFSKFLRSL